MVRYSKCTVRERTYLVPEHGCGRSRSGRRTEGTAEHYDVKSGSAQRTAEGRKIDGTQVSAQAGAMELIRQKDKAMDTRNTHRNADGGTHAKSTDD